MRTATSYPITGDQHAFYRPLGGIIGSKSAQQLGVDSANFACCWMNRHALQKIQNLSYSNAVQAHIARACGRVL